MADMQQRTALITGSSGLVGSEAVAFLAERGWSVHGIEIGRASCRERV